MFMRYAVLVTLGLASFYVLITAGTEAGQMIVADAVAGAESQNVAAWVLAAIALATMVSLCRFVFSGLPSVLGNWCRARRDWFYTIALGGLVCIVFYLM